MVRKRRSHSSDVYGSGTLSVSGGGSVSNSQGNVGYESGAMGLVTVSGPGSTWTPYNLSSAPPAAGRCP